MTVKTTNIAVTGLIEQQFLIAIDWMDVDYKNKLLGASERYCRFCVCLIASKCDLLIIIFGKEPPTYVYHNNSHLLFRVKYRLI